MTIKISIGIPINKDMYSGNCSASTVNRTIMRKENPIKILSPLVVAMGKNPFLAMDRLLISAIASNERKIKKDTINKKTSAFQYIHGASPFKKSSKASNGVILYDIFYSLPKVNPFIKYFLIQYNNVIPGIKVINPAAAAGPYSTPQPTLPSAVSN